MYAMMDAMHTMLVTQDPERQTPLMVNLARNQVGTLSEFSS